MTQAMELADEERVLPGHPLHDFSSDEHRSAVASLLGELGLAPAEERAAPAAS
jgi:hypothetical protein